MYEVAKTMEVGEVAGPVKVEGGVHHFGGRVPGAARNQAVQ